MVKLVGWLVMSWILRVPLLMNVRWEPRSNRERTRFEPSFFCSSIIDVGKAVVFSQSAAMVLIKATLVMSRAAVAVAAVVFFQLLLASNHFVYLYFFGSRVPHVVRWTCSSYTVVRFLRAFHRTVTWLWTFEAQPPLGLSSFYFIMPIILCAAMDIMFFSTKCTADTPTWKDSTVDWGIWVFPSNYVKFWTFLILLKLPCWFNFLHLPKTRIYSHNLQV